MMSKGEYRVWSFNHSADDKVAQIKSAAADLIDLIDGIYDSQEDSFISFADLHDIDTDDANAFLEGLGLEGVESDFPVTASFTYIIELNVKARNEDEANDKANDELFNIAPSSIRIGDDNGVEGGYANLDTYEIV